jgi:hypothetical protein
LRASGNHFDYLELDAAHEPARGKETKNDAISAVLIAAETALSFGQNDP